jgi:acyl-CoA synthetase (AMP-forming)/AMP-acid ligase II
MNVGSLVRRSALQFGPLIAVEGADGQLTFAELGDRVLRLAGGLLASGLRPGDRVLDLQTNSVRYLETDLAIRAAGLVRVALNYRLHPADWERIAEDSGARALIYDAAFEAAEPLARELDHCFVLGDGYGMPLTSLLDTPPPDQLPSPHPESLCGLHYSSGTTGRPKGAARTHRNWLASVSNMAYDVLRGVPDRSDTFVHAGPITHTSGLFILPFLAAGARQIVLPRWDSAALVEAVVDRGATHTALVPTMVSRLLEEPSANPDSLRPMKMLAYAGAPLPAEQVRAAHATLTGNLVQYYGLVEAIPPVTVLSTEDHRRGVSDDPSLLESAGRPALGVELEIRDASGRPLPPGEIGEVVTRGDHVMGGYWNAQDRDDLSKVVVDGWLHTGDLGHIDAFGYLRLVDRKADMIITGGYNVYPREVEEVIATVPGVAQVAVVGVPDSDWGERIVAVLTARPGATVTPEDVLDRCRAKLASYKKPKEVHVVNQLPYNSNGKVAKKDVVKLLTGGGSTP